MNVYFLLVCVWLSSVPCSLARKVKYDGYKVLQLTPQTAEHVTFIEKLKRVKGISFWRGPFFKIGMKSDVMVSPNVEQDLVKAIHASGIQSEEYVDDVQRLIDSDQSLNSTSDKGTRLNWNQYADLDKINEFLEEQSSLHLEDVKLITIGKSFEGRDLRVLKISKGRIPKPGIWIDSNIHAREWISGAVSTFIINELLNGQDTKIKSWTDDFDFYFLVIANPDGYAYTHTIDRLWRKTRSTTASVVCPGVDANRNFDFKWQGGGSSSDPCDDTYAGKAPFSEPETKAISDYYNTVAPGIVGFITLHSYAQLILLPYGVHGVSFPEYPDQIRLASKIQRAISTRYGTRYRTGSIVDVLYTASGGSVDWVRGVHNTKMTFVFELRDTGRHGFLLPPGQIIPTSLESIDGVQAIVDELRSISNSSKIKPILKSNLPHLLPNGFESQTFGAIPSRHDPIIPGFRRF